MLSTRSLEKVHSVHVLKVEQRAKRPPSLRPSHLTWAVSPPVGSYRLQPPSPFIAITQPESWYSFTVPRRVEGWVDLGTAGRVHTARTQGCKSQWFYSIFRRPLLITAKCSAETAASWVSNDGAIHLYWTKNIQWGCEYNWTAPSDLTLPKVWKE